MRTNTLLLIGVVFLFNIISIRAQIVIGEQSERAGISVLYELQVDVDEVAQILKDAPPLISEEDGVLLRLPLADGSFHTFELYEAPLMKDGLARKYNSVRSYKGWDMQHPGRVVRLNTGPLGVFAFIADHEDQSIIQPLVGEDSKHELYFSRNTYSNWTCGVDHEEIGGKENGDQPESTNNCTVNGTDYFTYIVVVSTTGEFYNLNGGTMSSALNALVNRLAATVIPYERDLAMTFQLSDSNDIVMYTDSLTDPYPNPTNRSESISIVDTVIQNHFNDADYDIGHGYHEIDCSGGCGWGGLAGVAVACVNSSKARAWTYQPFDFPGNNTVWSHEFGHQLSCWHTNYGCSSSGCHRYEPGRGVTIMSTGANCSGNDFYANRVDFFHAKSIEAILEYTNNGNFNSFGSSCNLVAKSGWNNCVQTTNSGNTPPTVTANPNNLNLTIPVNTPFRLDGTATDPEGNAMTYTWVDFNTDPNNTADPDNTASFTTAPLFRWFSPSTDTFRYFPMLTSILNGNTTTGTGEILPAVGRTMEFRFLARDNASPYGAIACDEITVTVDGGSGPFEITAPNTAVSWTAGNPETITWNVNNTDQAPINATNVDILLSTDGGQNFNISLATNTANDGSHSITVPSVTTTTARIKVQPSGDYIFFDINDADFSIDDPSCSANAYTISPESPLSAPEGDPALNLDMENEYSPAVTSLTDSTTTSDPTSNIVFEDGGSCAIGGNQPYYKEYIVNVSQSGTYTIGVPSRDGSVLMNYYSPSFDPNSVCMNWVGSNGSFSGGFITLTYPYDQMLNANQNYILTVNGFNAGETRNYTFSFSGPGDYHLGYIPISGFSYTYAIVNDGSGNIIDFDPLSDLTNEAPGNYTIYGIHYDDNITLSTYVGNPFSLLQNDILSGNICSSISSNSRSVEIETVLPVDFIAFNTWKNGNHAELQWEISNAYNVSHFAVQRWDEQKQEFLSIGRVEWLKEKTLYQYTDRHATSGKNLYRIESVDIDGSTDHTQIRAVHFGRLTEYNVYPSPADAMIYWQGPRENTESIRIYNTDGRLVYEQRNPQNQRIHTTNWPEGLYFVEFNTEVTVVRKKFLVAH